MDDKRMLMESGRCRTHFDSMHVCIRFTLGQCEHLRGHLPSKEQ